MLSLFRSPAGAAVKASVRRSANQRFFSSTRTSFNAAPTPAPAAKKIEKAGFFKTSWRVISFTVFAAIAYTTYEVYSELNPSAQIPHSTLKPNGNKRKTLVILGSGWGAISTLKNLDTTQYNVIVVSPRNYFLFTPLLPSVPTGTIDSKSIADPVRNISRQTPGEVTYLEASATDIDPVNKKIQIQHKSNRLNVGEAVVNDNEPIQTTIDYDYLVYAVGAKVNTFGIPGIAENASYLKELTDAQAVRAKIFNSIEASRLLPAESEERKRLLTVVVCGGGPTGVELAAEVKDFIDEDLSKLIPNIEKEMKVILVEAMPNVLNMFPQKLIQYTIDTFKSMNVDLKTNTMVKKCDATKVYTTVKNADGTTTDLVIPYGTLVWAGGNAQRELTTKLSAKIVEQSTARRGLLVDDFFKLDGNDSIYALGDCTFTKNAPTAQVAYQAGIFLGNHFNKLAKIDDMEYERASSSDPTQIEKLSRRIIKNKDSLKPFVYNHQGTLAYIGAEKAIADLTFGGFSTVSAGGSLTFLFWKTAYVKMMMGTRNRILVISDWIKVSLFGRDSSKD